MLCVMFAVYFFLVFERWGGGPLGAPAGAAGAREAKLRAKLND